MPKDKWLTTQQIADDLGYNSPSTVRSKIRKMLDAGTLKGEMISDTFLISEASYLKAKTEGAFETKQRRIKRGAKLEKNLKPNS